MEEAFEMKFTLNEWNFILHCLSLAAREYEKEMNSSPPSDDEHSSYRLFKKYLRQARSIMDRIENSEI